MDLKRIDVNGGTFQACGVTYRIMGSLSIERFCEFQILEKELGYGVTFQEMFNKIRQLVNLMNKLRFVEASVLLNDLLRGISKVNEREPTVLKICALFINADGEDLATISTDMMDKKIKDWKEEGLDMRDFFTVALNSVTGFLEIYRKIILNTSEPINALEDLEQNQSPVSK